MRLEAIRPGTYTVTLTAHELSTLLAGARMSLSLMDAEPEATTVSARATLETVLTDFDAALARAGRADPDDD